jgi:hypothetical protein
MHEEKITAVAAQLKGVMGRNTLRQLGDDSGFVIRKRAITADRFVPSLLKTLASRRVESLADMVRDFNGDHQLAIFYKPFYEKLDTPCFPRLMKSVFQCMLDTLCVQALAPLRGGPFARFRDIRFQDGTSFALHDGLAGAFRGRFTTISPAAVELHCTMSLFENNLCQVTITGDAECERHYLPDPKELEGVLIMGDRGYDSTSYMEAVDAAHGFFLIRARRSFDPRVLCIYARGERYRRLEGRPLSNVLRRLPKDKTFDLDVCWEKAGELHGFFRAVVRWNPTKKEWVRLLCNLDRESFSADDILQAYRLRWQIELWFKELKSYANLHKFSTTKSTIAEGLMWASLAAAFLKRYLAHACQHICGQAISTRRVAMCGHHLFTSLCASLQRGFMDLAKRLSEAFAFLSHNAKRANPRRDRARGRLALGLRLAGARG